MNLLSLVFAASVAVHGFDAGSSFFLEAPDLHPDPEKVSTWILTDEGAGTCKRVNSAWARKAYEDGGLSISDYFADRIYFLSWAGNVFWRAQDGAVWTEDGFGSWLPDGVWTQRAWQGQDLQFLNDPRPGHAQRWYQLGPSHACHVFAEASRSVGPADVLTVELSSGVTSLPAWTLTTGQASAGGVSAVGNWLP